MNFGNNLQTLRKLRAMTQEDLAEKLDVSRQTVSKWESDSTYPEMEKVIALCNLFGCTMDQLIREDLNKKRDAYSEIRIETLDRFRMARYLVISPEPEDDSIAHMKKWLGKSGLLDYPGYKPRLIGWDFPFLSAEQKNVYGLRGYVSAYIIPEDFTPECGGAEITWQKRDTYAVITVTDPFKAPFDLIPNAYKTILTHVEKEKIKAQAWEDRICFEEVFQLAGMDMMDIYVPVDPV
jgi:transcriptional regulator with XRE-family HTH domain